MSKRGSCNKRIQKGSYPWDGPRYIYIYLPIHEWLMFMVDVGKYTSPMDPMGINYSVVKVDGATPKRWRIVRGHDKPIHGSG